MENQRWECKIHCLQKPQEDPVKLNPNKIQAPENSLIKISSKGNSTTHVFAKVTAFDKELKNHGLSMEYDMSKVFEFQSNEEVVVEVVQESSCEIHMVEVTCADQYVSRGDMWRFKDNLVGTCTYKKKHMDFSWIHVQVASLYDESGEEMLSGYISENTHVTYRSLSSYTQLFIQIGKEMWENDYEGTENWENFEKVVYQFVKTLFDKWEASKANHDLQIIFFTRLFFEINKYPEYKEEVIQFDCDGRPYLDIYDIVCDGGNITDVKPIIGIMKRRFNKLSLIIEDLEKDYKVEVSSSSTGNFLECINLALDHYTSHFQDRVHYRTGQQIVVVTAGSGMFYVDRELTNLTKHRVLDMGVGADVVCLGSKPLHAAPLFVFQQQQIRKREERIFDRYQVPHWMNMHFYATNNKPRSFVPIIGLTGKDRVNGRIVPFRGPAPSFPGMTLENCTMKQLSQLCDDYDANLMKCPTLHPTSSSSFEINSDQDHHGPVSSLSSDAEIHSSSLGTTPSLDRRRTAAHNPIPESNPFKPSSLPRPITNSRRRWAHVFPSAKPPQKNWHGLSRSLRIEQDEEADHVDWQSLIAPACFPITTDYYPDTRYIDTECKEHPNPLSSTDIKQLQREIIIQRISRGFQIVLNKKNQSKSSLTVSLGDTYHDIKLLDNYTGGTSSGTITVKISKPEKKAQFPETHRIYKYCLLPYLGKLNDIDSSLLNCQSERTTREARVDVNWNKFDLYIHKLIDPDLGDDLRPSIQELSPWKSRYVILPRPDMYFLDHNVSKLHLVERWIVINFYNILFAMNHIKHQDMEQSDLRRGSLSVSMFGHSSAPNSPSYGALEDSCRPRTSTLVDAKSFSFSTGSSEDENLKTDSDKESSKSSVFKLFQKSRSSDLSLDSNELKEFRDSMLTPNSSMKFISVPPKTNLPGHICQPNLPPHTFISSYLVDFVKRTREDVMAEGRVLEFCQELLNKKIIEETIEHNEKPAAPIFINGFYFYNIKPEKPAKEKSIPKILFEVATPDMPNRIEHFFPITDTDVDIQNINAKMGDRKEFFMVDYDSCYHPQHAFGLTVQWDRATAQVIEMGYLSKWRNKAEKSGFQFLQVPLNPFDSPEMGQVPNRMPPEVTPFRAPIDIPIPGADIIAIHDMLYQFGFLHDYPAGVFPSDKIAECDYRKNDFVHLSGIALVRVSYNSGSPVLKWASNAFLGSKKWHPKVFLPNNKKEEKFYQMSFEDLLDRFMLHLKRYFAYLYTDSDV
ncbi:hypothetical protein ACHWQZ_G003359 [Mnemiopsis leidyi]